MKPKKSKKTSYLIQCILFIIILIIFLIISYRNTEPQNVFLGTSIFAIGGIFYFTKYKQEVKKEKDTIHNDVNVLNNSDDTGNQTQSRLDENNVNTQQTTVSMPATSVTHKGWFSQQTTKTKLLLVGCLVMLSIASFSMATNFGLFGLGSPVGVWTFDPDTVDAPSGMAFGYDLQYIHIKEDGTYTRYSYDEATDYTWIDDQGTWQVDGSEIVFTWTFGHYRLRRSFNKLSDNSGREYFKE